MTRIETSQQALEALDRLSPQNSPGITAGEYRHAVEALMDSAAPEALAVFETAIATLDGVRMPEVESAVTRQNLGAFDLMSGLGERLRSAANKPQIDSADDVLAPVAAAPASHDITLEPSLRA